MPKVIIPTKEEVKRMELIGAYGHFNQRLNERYSINITLDEYIELCKSPLRLYKKKLHSKWGIMNIKGVDVLVVREKHRKRLLKTALPYKNYKP